MRIIVFATPTEFIAEVLVVFVSRRRLLRMDVAFGAGFVGSEAAWRARWQSRRAAVAYKVALVEQLDQLVFTVAGY